jgi:integrase
VPKPATVVPLLGWKPSAAAQHAAQGVPLDEVFEAVERLVWSAPTFAPKSRANAHRTRELARALPPHPTPTDVMAWCVSLRSQFGEGTTHGHWSRLRTVYRYGADLGLCSGNPAALVPMRKPQGKPHPILDIDAQWPELLSVCVDERERAFLGVMRFAGLRRGEALGLRLDDVNTYADPWRLEVVRQRPDPQKLEHTKPKTPSSARDLAVRGPLRELLAPVLALGPVTVRTGYGGGGRSVVQLMFPYRESDLSDLGRRLREVAPLAFPEGQKMWHALRDTLAVEMHRKRRPTGDIRAVLGHTSEYVTTTHYLGSFGRNVDAGVFEGMDRPAQEHAPPDAGRCRVDAPDPAAEKVRRSRLAAATVSRVKRAVTNREGQETTCHTQTKSEAKRPARTLPGMSVGPVVTKPRRR